MVTAAVKGMTVAQMRKLLSEMRASLNTQTMVSPFLVDETLSNGQKIYEFAIDVTTGIHEKRSKTKKLIQAKLES